MDDADALREPRVSREQVSEHLADAYLKVGRTEDAIRAYRDCEARTEDSEQRRRVLDKLIKLEGRAESAASGI